MRGGFAAPTHALNKGSSPPAAAGGTRAARLEAVALFLPVVGVVVVAVALPEPGPVVRTQLEAAEPLGALPEVARGNDEAQRPAVVRRQRLAVGFPGDQ